MQLKARVAQVKRRTETIEERGKEPRQQTFEDVSLDFTGGDAFQGSAAGGIHFTIDNPAQLGKLSEGAAVTVTIT